jgi:hypothetical protein
MSGNLSLPNLARRTQLVHISVPYSARGAHESHRHQPVRCAQHECNLRELQHHLHQRQVPVFFPRAQPFFLQEKLRIPCTTRHSNTTRSALVNDAARKQMSNPSIASCLLFRVPSGRLQRTTKIEPYIPPRTRPLVERCLHRRRRVQRLALKQP